MRAPMIENKYNLDMAEVRKLAIANRSKLGTFGFEYRPDLKAWYKEVIVGDADDIRFATSSEYCMYLYDENAPHNAGQFDVQVYCYGGMCHYNFHAFYDPKEIEYTIDLCIQEALLDELNRLLDEGILKKEN